VATHYRAMAEEALSAGPAARSRRMRAARERIAEAEAKLLAMAVRWVDGELEADSYKRLKPEWVEGQASAALAELERDGVAERLAFVVGLLKDLPSVWRRADMEARDALVGSIWLAGFAFSDESFRTIPRSEIIALIAAESQ